MQIALEGPSIKCIHFKLCTQESRWVRLLARPIHLSPPIFLCNFMAYSKLHIVNVHNLMCTHTFWVWNHHHNENSDQTHHLQIYLCSCINPLPHPLVSLPPLSHTNLSLLIDLSVAPRVSYKKNNAVGVLFSWLLPLFKILLRFICIKAHIRSSGLLCVVWIRPVSLPIHLSGNISVASGYQLLLMMLLRTFTSKSLCGRVRSLLSAKHLAAMAGM